MRVKLYITILTLIFLFNTSCNFDKNIPQMAKLDLMQIRQQGVLTAMTSYNSTDYFIYRGEPMGFQYELLKMFAEHMGLRLQIRVTNNMEKAFQSLNSFNTQVLAMGLSPSPSRNHFYKFTEPFTETRQVLVQRIQARKTKGSGNKKELPQIKYIGQMRGITIVIQKNTTFRDVLQKIRKERGIPIKIVEDNRFDPEELIRKVARGEIDYTVCDEHVALVNKRLYPNIDISLAISPPVKLSWVVRNDATQLLHEINTWLSEFRKSEAYIQLYNKYFNNPAFSGYVRSQYYSARKGIISPFDKHIRKYSKILGWDWRLLASLIYQESQFDPYARSWTGAYGLMQLMPYNGLKYGLYRSLSDSNQIRAGVEHLVELDRMFAEFIWNEEERRKFVLAAYNAGIGQISDARMLARKYGKNPYKWDKNVDTFIVLKSYSKYYLDPVSQFGYCRGIETFNFVNEIMDRYRLYKNVIRE